MSDSDTSSSVYASARSREESPADALSGSFTRLALETKSSLVDPRPTKVRVLIQDACRQHKYARDSETYGIVERPERLRAINIGIAAAWARRGGDAALAVAAQMERMALGSSRAANGVILGGSPFEVVASTHHMELASPSVAFVHRRAHKAPSATLDTRASDQAVEEGPSIPYHRQLADWIQQSSDAHAEGRSEIPSHLPQGDLYLCPGSRNAIEGALGTTCAAIDEAIADKGMRFAAIRPPGHHCSGDSPSGFCLVNNVLVGAAHAYEKYGCDRIIIFDIDLHHGDGSQEIARQINADSEVQAKQQEARSSPRKQLPVREGRDLSPAKDTRGLEPNGHAIGSRPLKILYTSLHDIESFPCEDGDAAKITDASVCISGGHGQYICNVHLEAYENESDFHLNRYPAYRTALEGAAREFLRKTKADPAHTLVIVSAGFDACEHETPYMQRHGKRVPASFYARFAADAQSFASEHASDHIVAILEGGYSDRALISGMAAFLDGCLGYASPLTTDWDVKTLAALERACEGKLPQRRGESWISTAQSAFSALEGVSLSSSSANTTPRELRERKAKPTPPIDDLTPTRRAAPPKAKVDAAALVADETATVPPSVLTTDDTPTKAAEWHPTELPPPAIGKFKLTYRAAGIE